MTKSLSNLIWIDLEMTGLCQQTDHIIEIATVITDKELNVIDESPIIAIHQPNEVLEKMDNWNQTQHQKSGLYQRVQQSSTTAPQAEKTILDFVSKYVNKNVSPMAGNSICQDRRFLAREMPMLEDWFHYRNLDVSTLKELHKRWYSQEVPLFNKQSSHLALDDIYDSIEELKYYRQHLMR